MPPSWRGTTSYDITGSSDSVRYPWPIVVPNGPPAARSGSVWIHCWSPVASAKPLIFSCGISIQLEGPNCVPGVSSAIAPPYDTRRPGVAGSGREKEHELAVPQLPGARGPVEREQRVDTAHVTGVVEVRGAGLADAQFREQRAVHRRLHVDAAEVADVVERGAAPLERALGGRDEVPEAHLVEPLLHLRGIRDVEIAIAAVRRDAPARRHLHLQRERAVGEPVAAEELVAAAVLRQQPGDCTVAEVEHEARALVAIVEEVRLATR